jgi:integrase
MGKPFFRAQTKSWYFVDGKKFVRLGSDKSEAEREWHRRMAAKGTMAEVAPETSVAVILDRFLGWCKTNRAADTHAWYEHYLESLRAFDLGGGVTLGGLTLSAIKPTHVDNWIQSQYGDLSGSTRNAAGRCALRAFNWAVEKGEIPKNPIKGIEKARPSKRKVYIDEKQWVSIVAEFSADDPFADFITIMRETGCRPQEARAVEALHWNRDDATWVFPVDESKGKREARVVPLNNRATEITRRLALKYPFGPLFRNEDGEPWSRHSINCRFKRLSERLTKRIGTKFKVFAYAIRHTFVTDALRRGVDPVTLAAICGHSPKMTMEIYAQVQSNRGHMRKALAIATCETPETNSTATA